MFQDPRDALLRHRAERGLDGGDAAGLPAGGTSSAHWQSGEDTCSRNSKSNYLLTNRRFMRDLCFQGVGKNKLVDRLLNLLNRPREYIQLHRDTTVQVQTQISEIKNFPTSIVKSLI